MTGNWQRDTQSKHYMEQDSSLPVFTHAQSLGRITAVKVGNLCTDVGLLRG